MKFVFLFAGLLLGIGGLTIHVSRNLQQSQQCVQILYDNATEVEVLHNLLDAYSQYQQISKPIWAYEGGDLERCPVSIYVGSEAEQNLSHQFLNDFIDTNKRVVWMGYNIWQLGDRLEKDLGLRYIQTLAKDPADFAGSFKEVLYKGKSFYKDALSSGQVELLSLNTGKYKVLAEARHSITHEVIPYVVQARNHFYVADAHAPILADLLSELVEGAAIPASHYASAR